MNEWVISVSQLNEYVRKQLAVDPVLNGLTVRGELSGFKRYPSGHMYFSLKDESSRVDCVMFRQDAASVSFAPQDGMQVIVSGSASLYTATGRFQVYCRAMRREGVGDLFVRLEERKRRLLAEGLFDPARKRELPMLPHRVGIATSLSGAALRDMVRVLNRRFPGIEILTAPCAVQGENAAAEIARAIELLNENATCDVILCGRGGGSMEELSAFNEESVARAIYESAIPIISCVGHETDTTIADLVADARASTPSAAAEMAVPEMEHLQDVLDAFGRRMASILLSKCAFLRLRLEKITARPALLRPTETFLGGKKDKLRLLERRLADAGRRRRDASKLRLSAVEGVLRGLNPEGVLERGYAIVEKDGAFVRDASDVSAADALTVRLKKGRLRAVVTQVEEG
ncbi:MAG: exodeoxyribonuclease VII large subunit [Christensenellales bacterium]|jgi:exodeoxyribonuclease VII large subunit